MSSHISKFPLTRRLVAESTFADRPLRVIDAGARGGAELMWHQYQDQVEIIGFEPDPGECRTINRLKDRTYDRNEVFYPVALSSHKGRETLHITRNPNNSSLFKPNLELRKRYHHSEQWEITGEVEVDTIISTRS